jgi:hypothetical protein
MAGPVHPAIGVSILNLVPQRGASLSMIGFKEWRHSPRIVPWRVRYDSAVSNPGRVARGVAW